MAEGEFWLPDSPDNRVTGTLDYSPGSIKLRLVGRAPDSRDGLLRDDIAGHELILGATTAGACTLWKTVNTDSLRHHDLVAGEALSVATHSANRLYIGKAYESVSEIQFKDILVGFDVLPAWVGHIPFGSTEPESDALGRYVPFPRVVSVVPDDELQIELFTSVHDRGGGWESLTWMHEVRFVIRSPSPKDIEWHLDRLERLQAFLSALVGGSALPTSIGGHLDGVRDFTRVILPLKRPPSTEPPHPFQMLLPLQAVGDRMPDALATWMTEWERIRTAANLLFGTLIIDLPREFEFLALTQALETFHRHVHGGVYIDPGEYESVRSSLAGAIPAGIPDALSDALARRIEHGNEYSQRKRFKALLATLDERSQALLEMDAAFLDRVVEERNHLTHRPADTPDDFEPMDGAGLYFAGQRLKALLFLLLLSHLGFTGEDVEPRFPQTRWGWASRGWRIPPEVT